VPSSALSGGLGNQPAGAREVARNRRRTSSDSSASASATDSAPVRRRRARSVRFAIAQR
jgi:hypothetical protein